MTTDPRIAEIRQLLAAATKPLPMLDPKASFLKAQETRDWAIIQLKRRALVDIPYLLDALTVLQQQLDSFKKAVQAQDAEFVALRLERNGLKAELDALRAAREVQCTCRVIEKCARCEAIDEAAAAPEKGRQS